MKTILLIVAITIVGLVGFGLAYNFLNTGSVIPVESSLSATDAISVTISGEINRPGTYVLNSGTTMIDLITSASGTTSNADSLAFNVDHVLVNKGSYYIAPIYDNSNACAMDPIKKADINSASAEDLAEIAGFSKTVAAAIVSYRASVVFTAIEQIKDVPGIGQATYIATRDKITLRTAAA